MPDQTTAQVTVTAVCLIGIRHDRCKGVVRSLTGDRPCECPICEHEQVKAAS